MKKRWLTYVMLLLTTVLIMTGCKSNIKSNQNQATIDQTKNDIATSKDANEEVVNHLGGEPNSSQDESAYLDDLSNQDELSDILETTSEKGNEKLTIHFIDVDQGDCILVQNKGKNLLIDAGENDMGNRVVSYLNQLNIEKIDYLIGTHPHSDHIGGLDTVINNFKIGKIILPEVQNNTRIFEDVLTAISESKLKITKPVVGTKYELGDASFTILAPNSINKEDLNACSVGIRLVYGKTSYVFTGDAESVSEQEMVQNKIKLSADVLKVNHHGSRYSNTEKFLKAVNPKYAVIMVGKDNSYGHPHKEALARLKKTKAKLFRTDLQGTIILTSDGKTIQFQTEKTGVSQKKLYKAGKPGTKNDSPNKTTNQSSSSETVYVTTSGKKYHKKGCSYLKGDIKAISIDDAKKQGYTPCSRCN